MIHRRPRRMAGIIPCSNIAYTARRPMSNRPAISDTVMRPLRGLESQLISGLDMALLLCGDHPRAERVLRVNAAGFAGPPVLRVWPVSNTCDAVVSYGRGQRTPTFRLIRCGTLSRSRLAQCARAEALLELLLVHANGTGDADYAVRWYLALPDPEINRIRRNSESVGNFAYLCKSRRHRHDLVISSNHGCIGPSRLRTSRRFALLRVASHYFSRGKYSRRDSTKTLRCWRLPSVLSEPL